MNEFFNGFFELITEIIDWFYESGLAHATANTVGRVVTYATEQFIPLMWEYIAVIWGV